MSASVRIDFSRPIALFPLPAVSLFPHTAECLQAFEPRYRQMVEDCLRARGDGPVLGAAPIAMATYAGRSWSGERLGDPPLRPVVCVGKMVEHVRLDNGHHRFIIHGLGRARIESISEPDGRRLYRVAKLAPLESTMGAPRRLPGFNQMLGSILESPALQRIHRFGTIRDWLARGAVPSEVVVEQLLSMLARDDDTRYGLLAEPRCRERARFVLSELSHLGSQLERACERTAAPTMRGVTLN
ncbi:MAG: hypothetical protein GC172_08345 [Phycisphaera sp.]|nr:hypothetical protein [Phycisphaera sp.]